ncbi:RmlC-like cupin domain-containing protein [Sphaerosporella brunnea]|uniref:RmlC-like cupin domain-containing protein n=1 Tax=Sphaerosporella brunnea TaxID=1250544 RepID=A0A5J5EFK9_9PEZI|nr:RmlC-like cupin domain-containing protein [Sphaerosporella brunnea]KAA8893858.1 RmlC-like cupin domain-containing protein [Sphaerosporella brunnea]
MSAAASEAEALIRTLQLQPHPEGGFFRRTHEDTRLVPNPFATATDDDDDDATRLASTSIHYLLTPASPVGHWHRNKALTYHFLHRGRGRYRLLHPDGRLEEYVVGPDVESGERIMWVVEGGVWKTSAVEDGDGLLLISEVVVPGFEFRDHEFLDWESLVRLVGEQKAAELGRFLKKEI